MGIERQLQAGEEILYRARPSRVVLLPLGLLAVAFFAAGFILRGFTGNDATLIVCSILGAVTLAAAGVKDLTLRANEYVVTDRRIVRQTGLLAKSSMDIYLSKINNVEHRQTLLGRLLSFGDVEVDTASEVGEGLFPKISHPLDFKRAIVSAAEAYRGGGRPPIAVSAATPSTSGADKLRDLKKLLDDGLINQAEYDAKRKQLLDQL
jgi:membrane protein YdbS with pleckstrin-like domain